MPTKKTIENINKKEGNSLRKDIQTLDEFMERVILPDNECLFTIKPIKNQSTKIRLTPVVRSARCLCALSFIIEKKYIVGVKAFGYKQCCGNRKAIVRVIFQKDASLTFSDLFSQIHTNLLNAHNQMQLIHLHTVLPPTGPTGGDQSGGGLSGDPSDPSDPDNPVNQDPGNDGNLFGDNPSNDDTNNISGDNGVGENFYYGPGYNQCVNSCKAYASAALALCDSITDKTKKAQCQQTAMNILADCIGRC
jgi:hypothetical protein